MGEAATNGNGARWVYWQQIDPRTGIAAMIVLFVLVMVLFQDVLNIDTIPDQLWSAFALVVGYVIGAKTSEKRS